VGILVGHNREQQDRGPHQEFEGDSSGSRSVTA
jgi:hypothetical protein